jgi:hypothetical protein
MQKHVPLEGIYGLGKPFRRACEIDIRSEGPKEIDLRITQSPIAA